MGLSLVGHAIALDGRTLDDRALEWRVDGVGVVEGKRVAWINSLEVGAHRITTWRKDGTPPNNRDFCTPSDENERTWFNDLAQFREATLNHEQ